MIRVLVAVALALAAPASTRSQDRQEAATQWVGVQDSRVRMIAGQSPGSDVTYLAGVQIELAEGWKTYWRLPGDSGVPPSFDWSKSRNLASAEVLYPAPMRMPEAGGSAIGYKGAVIMPIKVTPKDPDVPVQLKLELEFGICRDICIPAAVELKLDLSPGASGPPPRALLAALDKVPRLHHKRRRADPELKRVRLVNATSPVRIDIEGIFQGDPAKADVFIEAPDGLYIPMPARHVSSRGGGLVRFESELSGELARDLKGKTLILTLVGEAGASESRWSVP